MWKRIRRYGGSRLAIAVTAAIVTAVLVAGGFAGALPGTRTVKADDVATGAVTSRAIRNDIIRSRDIKDETIKSKDIRDGTIGAADLAPEALAAIHARIDTEVNDLQTNIAVLEGRVQALEAANPGPRIAVLESRLPMIEVEHAESGNVNEAIFGSGTEADVLTVNISAPGPGNLVIAGTIDVASGVANSTGCHIEVDGSIVPGSVMFTSVGDALNGEGICSTIVTEEVTAGEHTVVFNVRNRASETFDDASLSAIWVRAE